ncbi:DUF4145 domain-containing protein [Aeromonas sobria]|uniref:DUF4145 domain-containing protein n=1 Tax=Aeromonas sobria TaxID=646 RepID=UPI0012FE8132|nr:DUF4145 domain-containing protein [Aeromonas sobria]
MASTKKVELNKSQNVELEVPCIKCSGKTTHKVLVSVDVRGEETDGNWSMQWCDDYQIIECGGCKAKSFRNVSSNSEDYYPISETEYEHDELELLYPSRIEGRKTLENEVHYLPAKVRGIYKETLGALNNNSPVLSGIGLRALIETLCKEKNAEGNSLYKKIDDLVAKKILTPAGASILHKIRTLGNDAAHEVKPHSEKQLGLAMDVVEHVLNDVYIIPEKVEAEFGA